MNAPLVPRAAVIANAMLSIASRQGRGIPPLKLLKMVYFAHTLWWARHGQPLFSDPVIVSPLGPTIVDLQRQLQGKGHTPVRRWLKTGRWFWDRSLDVSPEVHFFLERFEASCAHTPQLALSAMAHCPGSPWFVVWGEGRGVGQEIPAELMVADVKRRLVASSLA